MNDDLMLGIELIRAYLPASVVLNTSAIHVEYTIRGAITAAILAELTQIGLRVTFNGASDRLMLESTEKSS